MHNYLNVLLDCLRLNVYSTRSVISELQSGNLHVLLPCLTPKPQLEYKSTPPYYVQELS